VNAFSWSRIATAAGALLFCATVAAQEVNVGAILALTGPNAFAGVASQEGILVALEEVNAAPGTKIRLQIEDSASEKTQAITLANRFGSDQRYLAVLGPTSSSEGVSVAPVANAVAVPLVTTTATADAITKAGQWSFKTPASPNVIIEEIAKYAVEKGGVKRVVLVSNGDNEGSVNQKDFAKRYFEAHGVNVLSDDLVLSTDSNFLALVTKMTAQNIDAVYTTILAEQAANLIVQARQAGLDPKVRFFGTPTMGSERFIAVGGKAVEGSTFVADYFVGSTSSENTKFVDAFQKKYKKFPDNWAALGYTALKVVAQAVRSAGPNPTRESVRRELAKIRDMPTILGTGKFSFDENRNPHYGAFIVSVQNGKFVMAQ